jgi:hypothetical protein
MSDNDNNLDNIILRHLRDHGHERENELVNAIFTTCNNQRERGFLVSASQVTIRRHLRKLVSDNRILKITYTEFSVYGINEKNKKAVYYAVLTPPELREHFDVVIGLLKSDDLLHIKHGLKELKRYDTEYCLTPKQLSDLAQSLKSDDPTLLDAVTDVLFNYIITKHREPSDQEAVIDRLAALLKEQRQILENLSLLRRRVIRLLAHYNQDSLIIGQIKKNAKSSKSKESFLDDYNEGMNQPILIAPVIERNNTELLRFEIELEENGEPQIAVAISDLRDQCHNLLYPTVTPKATVTMESTEPSPKLPKVKTGGKR